MLGKNPDLLHFQLLPGIFPDWNPVILNPPAAPRGAQLQLKEVMSQWFPPPSLWGAGSDHPPPVGGRIRSSSSPGPEQLLRLRGHKPSRLNESCGERLRARHENRKDGFLSCGGGAQS